MELASLRCTMNETLEAAHCKVRSECGYHIGQLKEKARRVELSSMRCLCSCALDALTGVAMDDACGYWTQGGAQDLRDSVTLECRAIKNSRDDADAALEHASRLTRAELSENDIKDVDALSCNEVARLEHARTSEVLTTTHVADSMLVCARLVMQQVINGLCAASACETSDGAEAAALAHATRLQSVVHDWVIDHATTHATTPPSADPLDAHRPTLLASAARVPELAAHMRAFRTSMQLRLNQIEILGVAMRIDNAISIYECEALLRRHIVF
jgi:hypothetical protein